MNNLFKKNNSNKVSLPLSLKIRSQKLKLFSEKNNDKIDLWLISINKLNSLEKLYLDQIKLTFQSYQRFSEYINPHDQYNYLLRTILLKDILSKYTGQSRESITFNYNIHKKPFLDEKYELYFNMSYSDNLCLIGVSRFLDLGVDIELVNPLENISSLLDCFASPKEKQWTLETSTLLRFYILWTVKESLVKAIGTGFLAESIPELDVLPQIKRNFYISRYKSYIILTKLINKNCVISYSY